MLLKIVVSSLRVVGLKVLSELLEGFVRTFVSTVNSPDEHSFDMNSTHFGSNLLRFEGNHLRSRRKFGDLVEGSDKGAESNLSLLKLSVVDDEYPFISLSCHPKSFHVLNQSSESLLGDD